MTEDIDKLINEIKTMYEKGSIKNRIEQIKIHNFRKFYKNSEMNFLFPMTVIVGKNGSGKTTIMKSIKLLSGKQIPQDEFFETVIDDGGFKDTQVSYLLDGSWLKFKRVRQNEWGKEGTIPVNLDINYIETKSMVGAIDKSLLYDDVSKNTNRTQKIEYIIKQSKKIKQNPLSISERKQRYFLSDKAVKIVNWILQGNINSIEVLRHKYYSGTWGISIIFNDGQQYSEYNAGSGEFVIANVVDRIEKISIRSVLLLDEPEISLHPGAQRRLMCYILETIKKKRIQVIITTHSATIVENLPKSSIKCFRKFDNNSVLIEEEVFFKNAFLELELAVAPKYIIVEDDMAKRIIDKILKQEGLDGLIQVNFYPGGADNIKKHTILTYSKTKIQNHYVMFDGDQRKKYVPDFSKVLEVNKTEKFLKELFKDVVGISSDKMEWAVDANSKEGRFNAKQLSELHLTYLEYFRDFIFFLPQTIPEDIVYDEEKLKVMFGLELLPDVSEERDSKKKLKKISDEIGMDIENIESYLIHWFIKRKNTDYKKILSDLKKIIER